MPLGLYIPIVLARYNRFEALMLDLNSKGETFIDKVASIGGLARSVSYSNII
jgi:hypothetical protein